jgi:hypothetical protein
MCEIVRLFGKRGWRRRKRHVHLMIVLFYRSLIVGDF